MSEIEDSTQPDVPPLRRNETPAGWILLFLIFAGLILGHFLVPETKGEASSFDLNQIETGFKTAVVAKEFSEMSPTPSASNQADTKKTFQTLYNQAMEYSGKDSDAAKFTLTLGHMLKKEPDAKALKRLQSSKKSEDKDYADIYTSSSLKPEWVQRVRPELPKTFLGKVALEHALEKSGQTQAAKDVVTPKDGILIVIVFGGALLAVAAGMVVVIGGILALVGKSMPEKGFAVGELTPGDKDRLALRMAVFLIMFVFIPGLVAKLLNPVMSHFGSLVVGEVVFLICFGLVSRTPLLGVADSFKKLIGSTENVPKLIGIGFLGFLANLPIVMLLMFAAFTLMPNAARPTHPLSEEMGAGAGPLTIAMMFILAVVMAPILEELSFRGLLFPALSKFMKPVGAMITSGLLFGMIHPQGPMMWAALAAIGSMSAFLSYRTGSLIPSMVMHAFHNGAILTLTVALLY